MGGGVQKAKTTIIPSPIPSLDMLLTYKNMC